MSKVRQWVRDVEADHVADADVVIGADLHVGVLVHHFAERPVSWGGVGGGVAGPVMERGCGKAGVKGGITLAEGNDGAFGFRDGLHAGPNLQCRLKRGMHLLRDGIAGEDSGLRLAIGADIVGEITTGAKNQLDSVAEPRSGEFFRDDVIPGRACAGENGGSLLEAACVKKRSGDVNCALQEGADEGFLVENALIHFHSAERDGFRPFGKRGEDGVHLLVVANARAAAHDSDFKQDIEALVTPTEEGAKLIDLVRRIDEAVVGEFGIGEQAGNDGHVLAADELVGHENAADSVLPCDEALMRCGKSDSPGAGLELHVKQPRSHRGFAVRRELNAVSAHEFAHPFKIVLELVFVEDGARHCEIFKEEIPSEGRDDLGRLRLIEKAHAFIEGRDGGKRGRNWGCGLVHSMDLQLGFKKCRTPWAKHTPAKAYIVGMQ